MWNVKCENVTHVQNNVTIANNVIILLNLKMPQFFSR